MSRPGKVNDGSKQFDKNISYVEKHLFCVLLVAMLMCS